MIVAVEFPSLEVNPLSAWLGAAVTNFDPQWLSLPSVDGLADRLRLMLRRYQVLFFPRIDLDLDVLARFAALFGAVLSDRRKEGEESEQIAGWPDLKVLSNVISSNGLPIGDKGADAQCWHIDGTHRARPNAYAILYGREAPTPPPRTSFISLYTLYEALPVSLKREIANLEVIHSLHNRSQSFQDVLERAAEPVERRAEGPRHPLVTLHPETLRPCLYLPRRRDSLVAGYAPERSRRLMERLWAELLRSDASVSVALGAGDLVLFDNRAVMHDREGWDPDQPRVVVHVAMEPQDNRPAFPRTLARRDNAHPLEDLLHV